VDIAAEEELVAAVMPDGEVDNPNTTRITRQVLTRDGLRCANPACDRRLHLMGHHIVFRSLGGRTLLFNETAVCDLCHAMIHSGRLTVTGTHESGLTWTPRPVDPTVKVRDAESLRARLDELIHSIPSVPAPTGAGLQLLPRPAPAQGEFTHVDCPAWVLDLAEGLVRLGIPRAESRHRVREAFAALVAAGSSAVPKVPSGPGPAKLPANT